MAPVPSAKPWHFYRFGLIVTGELEEIALPCLFRCLMASRTCAFTVIRPIGQRGPLTSEKRKLRMVGSGKLIPDKDEEEIGLPARRFLAMDHSFVVLVDDLEHSRRGQAREVFGRYRKALDVILRAQGWRASVHFLVNMVEAYFLADAKAVNEVLGTELTDSEGDVEAIRHPKNELKSLKRGYRETAEGREILEKLDVEHVLTTPETCASLRTVFAWCCKAMGEPVTSRFRLDSGVYSVVTGPQIGGLA